MSNIAADFARIRIQGGFSVILADAPFPFDTYSDKGKGKSPERHYMTMSIDEITAMPVHLLAAQNCTLFFWCTWPLMPYWIQIIEGWGFDYAGLAWEWIKYNPETGKYAFGGGYGTRKNLEPCLMCTRGNPSLRKEVPHDLLGFGMVPEGVRSVRDFILATPQDALRAPRREHSRKPEEQYKRIETLCAGPYLELFARSNRKGWTSWGNQIDKFGGEQ